jgi:AraC-like DNA-binding protein
VAQAKLLLSTAAMNVSEVARSCGYADPGYFTRQFRKITGVTPSAYRSHVVSG